MDDAASPARGGSRVFILAQATGHSPREVLALADGILRERIQDPSRRGPPVLGRTVHLSVDTTSHKGTITFHRSPHVDRIYWTGPRRHRFRITPALSFGEMTGRFLALSGWSLTKWAKEASADKNG